MMIRTKTMELRAIRERMYESPPPPPNGTTVREWFAGLALASPELMKDVPMHERAAEAVRLADDLVKALAAPRMPSKESMAPPTEEAMALWDKKIEDQTQATNRPPASRTRRESLHAMLPPPPAVPNLRIPTPISSSPTAYSSVRGDLE